MNAVAFTVAGTPRPQGSKRHIGHGAMLESSRHVGPWRERVAIAAHNAMHGQPLFAGPVHLLAQFVLPRPKSAPKTKPTPPATCTPDLDKLVRAISDAITGVIVHTDAQIVSIVATKRRAELNEPFIGASIHIRTGTPGVTAVTPLERPLQSTVQNDR